MRSGGPTSAISSISAVRHRGGGVTLLAVQEQVLDLLRLGLEPVARDEVVVEVLPAGAHAADVEPVVGPERIAGALEVVGDERRDRRRDVEAGARERRGKGLPRAFGREEDREPAVGDLGGELDRLRLEDGEVDRDVGAKRPRHQLERLPESRRARAGVRNLVVQAVVLERLPPERPQRTISTYSRSLRQRLPPGLAVPALDHLRAREAEPEQEAAAGHAGRASPRSSRCSPAFARGSGRSPSRP